MEPKLENLYRSMILLHSMFKRPKRIKVKTEFYNYLVAKYKTDTYFINLQEEISTFFTGILVVVDDTIDNYYELEF